MANSILNNASDILGYVTVNGGKCVIANATVSLSGETTNKLLALQTTLSVAKGRYHFKCAPGNYTVSCEAFGARTQVPAPVGSKTDILLNAQFELALSTYGEGGTRHHVSHAVVGEPVLASLQLGQNPASTIAKVRWMFPPGVTAVEFEQEAELVFDRAGNTRVEAIITGITSYGKSSDSGRTDLADADGPGKYSPPPELLTALDVVVSRRSERVI